MKKLSLLFCVFYNTVLLSQTVLNSFPLDLNRPLENGQMLNTEDVKTNDIYVFAADDKYINILQYNKFLFLKNQFRDSIKNAENRSIIGHSISDDGNPILYWATDNLRNIRIIKYYLETKTIRALNFDMPLNNEYIISSFQKNNIFYILSKETDQQHLLLYEFNNGKCEIKMFDFSAIPFQNEKGQSLSFNTLIRYYPIEKMDTDNFNPLDKTSSKSKMYVLENEIILTFDYNLKSTKVLNLNFETLGVSEKIFNQPVSKTASKTSNSFFYDNKLLQVKASNEELLFDIKAFDSGKTLKNFTISKNDTIPFKNSPLFVQISQKKPQEVKTTAKFLKQLSDLNAGISAFKNRKNTFISLGGFAEYQVLNYNYGQDNFFGDFNNPGYSEYSNKMVFFDSMFNSGFEFVNSKQPEPLAIDNVYYYLSINKNISLQNILKVKDDYILGYYDPKLRQFIMRKFTDGFMNEDNGNPIMNKAQFSKPSTFGKIKFIEN
ncbi:hypothetical protein [Flavobacterium sp.]|uniref:hypothetical protein n=1 Tax=Flavobacterium sp. TaxID=239 RepID=UPI003262E7F5